MSRVRRVSVGERRARLAIRHALAPAARAADAETATRAMTVLHSTEPATVYLSLWARVPGLTTADVEDALYDERSLVKQLAMRRTLFVFPRDLLPAAWGSASARVARMLRARLVKEIEEGGLAPDGAAWVDAAAAATMRHLADGVALSAKQLREQVAELAGHLDVGRGTYAATVSVAPRVLTQLAVEGHVVRGRNEGHWRVSRPLWTASATWLGDVPDAAPERDGYAELVRRWLYSFGPGTEADLVWWLGATKAAVRAALADVGAVAVLLDDDETGWLLPDDVEEVAAPESWVALLPVLDPTVMGWKRRDFYLGGDGQSLGPQLFDRNGNAGTTAWADGRVVGCWTQDEDAAVRVHPLVDLDRGTRRALDAEARRLTDWLDGVKVGTVYPSPAMRESREGAS